MVWIEIRELRRVNKIVKNQNPVKLSFVILRSLKEHTFYDESRIVKKCTALFTLPLLIESERKISWQFWVHHFLQWYNRNYSSRDRISVKGIKLLLSLSVHISTTLKQTLSLFSLKEYVSDMLKCLFNWLKPQN